MELDFLVKSHLAFCGAALEHQAKQLELAFAWVSIYPIKCKDKRERERCGERGGNPLLLWISRDNLWLLYRVQGRRKFWKPKGVNSNVVGIICSPVGIGLCNWFALIWGREHWQHYFSLNTFLEIIESCSSNHAMVSRIAKPIRTSF